MLVDTESNIFLHDCRQGVVAGRKLVAAAIQHINNLLDNVLVNVFGAVEGGLVRGEYLLGEFSGSQEFLRRVFECSVAPGFSELSLCIASVIVVWLCRVLYPRPCSSSPRVSINSWNPVRQQRSTVTFTRSSSAAVHQAIVEPMDRPKVPRRRASTSGRAAR